MGLGDKLQAVHEKVYTKLGTQEGDVVFVKQTVTKGEIGQPYASQSSTSVTLTEGVMVSRVNNHSIREGSIFQLDDLILKVPGNLITEAQLTDSKCTYNGQTYSIVSKKPVEIYSGVVTQWEIILRVSR